jgi:hypothetical protein
MRSDGALRECQNDVSFFDVERLISVDRFKIDEKFFRALFDRIADRFVRFKSVKTMTDLNAY